MSGNDETTRETRMKCLMPIQYRVAELPVVIGVGKTKINEWLKRGSLKSYKIEGTVFVHVEDVVKFIEQHRQSAFDLEI